MISTWLGHADPSVTARLYLHSDATALRDTAKTLGEINKPRRRKHSKPDSGAV